MTSTRRIEIARALIRARGAAVSGEALAAELGISRVAVLKHVQALRETGFDIEAEQGSGYRLVEEPALAIPETVAPRVTDPLLIAFAGGAGVASTNDDAKAAARAGAAEGTVVIAASQSAGRGRFGRTWESPSGGAYTSVVLRPAMPPVAVSPLALVVACGIARGLDALGVRLGIKWPNDLVLDGRKVAGVLLEMSAEADIVEWVVAGWGLNVRRPLGAPDGAAFLQDAVSGSSPPEVAALALDGVAGAYRRFASDGFVSLAGEFEARDVLRGASVVVRDLAGRVTAEGEARGVDDAGRLLVGGTAVAAGEVTLGSGGSGS
ncbi:MAG: biotin--[acetyl-CoA-carboxylase] ligase [Anaerosomatales bacterium]|nr:biotin--[acetyl-CoA-carboxylase] ligase [Anaerosomatales bacterium]